MDWLLDRLITNERLRKLYEKFLTSHVRTILWLTRILSIAVALLFVVIGFVYIVEGEDGKARVESAMSLIAKITYSGFYLDRLCHYFLAYRDTKTRYKWFGHVVNVVLLLSLLFPLGDSLQIILLSLLVLMDLSKWFISMLGRRANASLILSLSFLFLITLGTVLLMAPLSLRAGVDLSFVNAIFISTSAVCVTGLSPVDVSSQFTLEGQLVLLFLIQVGGLGIMTITSFFALLMTGNTTVYNQMVVKDLVSSKSLTSLLSMLSHILGFTFLIEILGAIFIGWSMHGEEDTLGNLVLFSVFHSVSAFCNAGFSTLQDGLSNPSVLKDNMNHFYLILSVLIFLGSIGYPLLVNIKEWIIYTAKWILPQGSRFPLRRRVHVVDINTKLVFSTTILLVLAGTILMALFEWNGAFSGYTIQGKLTHALFNAVSPRTAGFSSAPLTTFGPQTIIVYTLLMWIGGAAQSTAGGIKVNVFGLALRSFWANLRGMQDVILFRRRASVASIRRAHATIVASLAIIFIAFGFITWLEPNLPKGALFFEVVSAISTVGSSLDITSKLSDPSKVLVIVLMFSGRVGIFTLLTSFIRQKHGPFPRYPEEDVLVG